MKLFSYVFLFVIMTLAGLNKAFAQVSIPKSITGIWTDSNSTAFSNGYAIFSVDKMGKVMVTHYVEYNGTPMVEQGIGFFAHNTVNYDVQVTKAISGWATKGQHVLTLSEDGQTLRGHYKDEKGNTGALVFKRLRP